MKERPRGAEIIILGEFSIDLEGTDGQGQYEDILAAISMLGLEDLAGHLLPRRQACCKDWRTCEIVRQGMVVRSWTD